MKRTLVFLGIAGSMALSTGAGFVAFAQTPPEPQAPTLTFTASPLTIKDGESSRLTWVSTNVDTCTASEGWSGLKVTSGSASTTPSQTTNYTLKCTGLAGSVTKTVSVAVVPPPPPALASGTCQTMLNSSVAVPTGYGAAYNPFSDARELMMTWDCSGATPKFIFGSGLPTQYIYKSAYAYKNGQWQPLNVTSSGALVGDNWFAGTATANLPFTDADLSSWNYVAGYMCVRVGSAWKCGCSDTSCTTSTWQLQGIKK